MTTLSPARRRELRAAAHHLNPVASVADKGLSPAVVAEIERALATHELIKVRIYGEDRAARAELMAAICQALGAEAVQHIGNILVIWREKPAEVAAEAKPPRPARKSARTTGTESFARSARSKVLAAAKPSRQTTRRAPGTPSRSSGHRVRTPR